MFGKSKEEDVLKLFVKHTEHVQKVLNSLDKTVKFYIEKDPEFENTSYNTHTFEHEADEIEREIRKNLYEGAFVSGIRGLLVALVVKIEKIAGSAVIVVRKLVEERPELPKEIIEDIIKMTEKTIEVGAPLHDIICYLRTDLKKVIEPCEKISDIETEIDSMLHKSLTKLFSLDIELARKTQIRDWFLYLHHISDLAEDITDLMAVITMKLKI